MISCPLFPFLLLTLPLYPPPMLYKIHGLFFFVSVCVYVCNLYFGGQCNPLNLELNGTMLNFTEKTSRIIKQEILE